MQSADSPSSTIAMAAVKEAAATAVVAAQKLMADTNSFEDEMAAGTPPFDPTSMCSPRSVCSRTVTRQSIHELLTRLEGHEGHDKANAIVDFYRDHEKPASSSATTRNEGSLTSSSSKSSSSNESTAVSSPRCLPSKPLTPRRIVVGSEPRDISPLSKTRLVRGSDDATGVVVADDTQKPWGKTQTFEAVRSFVRQPVVPLARKGLREDLDASLSGIGITSSSRAPKRQCASSCGNDKSFSKDNSRYTLSMLTPRHFSPFMMAAEEGLTQYFPEDQNSAEDAKDLGLATLHEDSCNRSALCADNGGIQIHGLVELESEPEWADRHRGI